MKKQKNMLMKYIQGKNIFFIIFFLCFLSIGAAVTTFVSIKQGYLKSDAAGGILSRLQRTTSTPSIALCDLQGNRIDLSNPHVNLKFAATCPNTSSEIQTEEILVKYQSLTKNAVQVTLPIEDWKQISQTHLSSIVPHPTNPSILYGLNNKTFYKSTDSGVTWTQVPAFSSSGDNLQAFTVSKSSPETIYVVGYRLTTSTSIPNPVVYKSTNGGNTFTQIYFDSQNIGYLNSVVISPSNTSIIYIGGVKSIGNGGLIYKSTNSGSTWSLIYSDNTLIRSLAIHPSNANVVYAAGNSFCGNFSDPCGMLLKSVNGGMDFTKSPLGMTLVVSLVTHPSNANILFAADHFTSTFCTQCVPYGQIYKSTDSGSTWTSVWSPSNSQVSQYLQDLSFNPAKPSILYAINQPWAGQNELIKSIDTGESWGKVYGDYGLGKLAFNSTRGYLTSSSGILSYPPIDLIPQPPYHINYSLTGPQNQSGTTLDSTKEFPNMPGGDYELKINGSNIEGYKLESITPSTKQTVNGNEVEFNLNYIKNTTASQQDQDTFSHTRKVDLSQTLNGAHQLVGQVLGISSVSSLSSIPQYTTFSLSKRTVLYTLLLFLCLEVIYLALRKQRTLRSRSNLNNLRSNSKHNTFKITVLLLLISLALVTVYQSAVSGYSSSKAASNLVVKLDSTSVKSITYPLTTNSSNFTKTAGLSVTPSSNLLPYLASPIRFTQVGKNVNVSLSFKSPDNQTNATIDGSITFKYSALGSIPFTQNIQLILGNGQNTPSPKLHSFTIQGIAKATQVSSIQLNWTGEHLNQANPCTLTRSLPNETPQATIPNLQGNGNNSYIDTFTPLPKPSYPYTITYTLSCTSPHSQTPLTVTQNIQVQQPPISNATTTNLSIYLSQDSPISTQQINLSNITNIRNFLVTSTGQIGQFKPDYTNQYQPILGTKHYLTFTLPKDLPSGTYTGDILLKSSNQSFKILVSVVVGGGEQPVTPNITWDPGSLNINLMAGEGIAKVIKFTSDQPLNNIAITIEQSLREFVSVDSLQSTNLQANTPNHLALVFKARKDLKQQSLRGNISIPGSNGTLPISIAVTEPSSSIVPTKYVSPDESRVSNAAPNSGYDKYVNDELFIYFKDGVSQERAKQIIQAQNGKILSYLDGFNRYQVVFDHTGLSNLNQKINSVKQSADVKDVMLHWFAKIEQGTKSFNDPGSLSDENIKKIKLPEAWNITTGNKSVNIAIIDDTFLYERGDFKGNVVFHSGLNTYFGTIWYSSHGTGIASIIGSKGDNGKSIAGVMWDASLMLFSAGKQFGSGSSLDLGLIEEHIKIAIDGFTPDKSAKIINLSLGLPGNSLSSSEYEANLNFYKKFIDYARKSRRDILFVIAAGNQSTNAKKTIPASLAADPDYGSNVVSVSNFDVSSNKLSTTSNYGKHYVTIAAPGTNVCTSTFLGLLVTDNFSSCASSGTSFSAPYVSGVAGLMLSVNPNLAAKQLKELLVCSATLTGKFDNDSPRNEVILLNAEAAVLAAKNGQCTNNNLAPGRIRINVRLKDQNGNILGISSDASRGLLKNPEIGAGGEDHPAFEIRFTIFVLIISFIVLIARLIKKFIIDKFGHKAKILIMVVCLGMIIYTIGLWAYTLTR